MAGRNKVAEMDELRGAILDQLPAPVVVVDRDLNIIYMNAVGYTWIGKDFDEIKGRKCSEVFTAPYWDAPEHPNRRALEAGETCVVRDEITHRGERIQVEYVAAPLKDRDGKPIGVVGCLLDIADQTREGINPLTFRALTENANDAIAMISLKGRVLYSNRAGYELFGYDHKAQEITGRPVTTFWPKEERGRLTKEVLPRAVSDGWRGELQLRRRDNTLFSAAVAISPIRDTRGQAVAVSIIVHDITEQRRAEKVRSVLLQISEATNLSGNLEELLRIIHQHLGTLIDTTNFYVALYDKEKDVYTFPYHVDEHDEIDPAVEYHLSGSMTDYVRRTGVPLLVDKQLYGRLIESSEVQIVGAPSLVWLGVPLDTAHGVIGVVAVQSYTDGAAYSARDTDLLSFVSGNIALAIERKRAEQALRLTQFTNDYAADAIFWVDLEGRFTYVNRTMCQRLGYTGEEMSSMTISDVDANMSADAWPKILEEARHRRRTVLESLHRTKDGNTFPVETIINYLEYEGKELICAFARDITEQKQAEETIVQQDQAIAELSTPVIQVWQGIIMMPLIGVIDTMRAQQMIERLLEAIVEFEASVAIMDVTGVPLIDTSVARHLLKAVEATKMMGAEVIITGFSPEAAQTLVALNVNFDALRTRGSLRAGIADAFALIGKQITSRPEGRRSELRPRRPK